ncbi:hypothetical protein Salat_1114200 [Sesamum alatum]|uniref:Uncharacterized protein n=1 Tax=Sesamum alatum TaxID=300844 RepID=A0AAE2CTF8_9LAMI|nr:hypothetical protein Salat_1114200 [Sesamum alatum]
MANTKTVHTFSTLLFLTLLILDLASARSVPIKLSPKEKNQRNLTEKSFEITPCNEMEKEREVDKAFTIKNRKLGIAYGPSLMSMLPKGRIPASGPSRRINGANN